MIDCSELRLPARGDGLCAIDVEGRVLTTCPLLPVAAIQISRVASRRLYADILKTNGRGDAGDINGLPGFLGSFSMSSETTT